MSGDLIAKSNITIHVPVAKVWDALINPSIIKQYMFGTEVVSEWKEGNAIIWRGNWKGKQYEDKGKILQIVPQKTLEYTHFSPLSGAKDLPENYHTMKYELDGSGEITNVSLSQDNNATEEERAHSQQMWDSMLESMKKLLES